MRSLIVSVFAIAVASATSAQVATPVSVRIRIGDATGAPVSGAEVSIVRKLSDVLASGQTDARGERTLVVANDGDPLHLVVRKIGYQRAEEFLQIGNRSSLAVTMQLVRVAALDTVQVTAAEDVRRKSYFIDAEEIEKSPRPIINALDIVQKLRPDMIFGRQGTPDMIDQHVKTGVPSKTQLSFPGGPAGASVADRLRKWAKYGYCPPVQNVFVNGARIHTLPIDAGAALSRTGLGEFIPALVATVLASVKPEHVAEMSYVECSASSAPDMPMQSSNAIHIVLKPGVSYAPGLGSYVIAEAPPASSVHHGRLVGVFDQESGLPLTGVEVADTLTRTSALTTTSGTVSLVYLPEGESTIRISKAGYQPITMPVAISPHDTTGITVLLEHLPSGVPAQKTPPVGSD